MRLSVPCALLAACGGWCGAGALVCGVRVSAGCVRCVGGKLEGGSSSCHGAQSGSLTLALADTRTNRLALIEGERANWLAIEVAVRADQFGEREWKAGHGV